MNEEIYFLFLLKYLFNLSCLLSLSFIVLFCDIMSKTTVSLLATLTALKHSGKRGSVRSTDESTRLKETTKSNRIIAEQRRSYPSFSLVTKFS